jgi:hypothetical protein
MRRRKRVEPDTMTLVAGAAGAVWRCRFELALAAVIVSAQMLLAGLMGNFAAAVLLFAAASGMLAGAGSAALAAAGVAGGTRSAGVVAGVDGLRVAARACRARDGDPGGRAGQGARVAGIVA